MLFLLTTAGLAAPADPVAGKFWYEQNCARCHGSPPQERQAGTPNISGASAERIRSALGSVAAMFKVSLSEAQLLDVEAYLREPVRYLDYPGIDFSDVWWNPQESGWGLNLKQRSNSKLIGFIYLYDATGAPLWLMCTDMQWLDPLTSRGTLLQVRASGFPPAGFDASTVNSRVVGEVLIRFFDAASGTLSFSIDGVAYQKPIRRFEF